MGAGRIGMTMMDTGVFTVVTTRVIAAVRWIIGISALRSQGDLVGGAVSHSLSAFPRRPGAEGVPGARSHFVSKSVLLLTDEVHLVCAARLTVFSS